MNDYPRYEFECGCRYPIDSVDRPTRAKVMCPIHGKPAIGKIFKCQSYGCGAVFSDSIKANAKYCLLCRDIENKRRNNERSKRVLRQGGYTGSPPSRSMTGQDREYVDHLAFLDSNVKIPKIEDFPGLMDLMDRGIL